MISIIIPTYNMAHFLQEALHSIIANSFRDIEIIIVDDGSTDDTTEVIATFKKQTSVDLSYLYTDHQGKACCLNEVFRRRAVHGNYIMFMDADDLLPEDSLEHRYHRIRAFGAEMAIGSYTITDISGRVLESRVLDQASYRDNLIRQFFFSHKIPFNLNAAIIAKKLFYRVGPFDEKLWRGQEVDYAIRLLQHTKKLEITPPVVYYYRKYPRSLGCLTKLRFQTARGRMQTIHKHLKGLDRVRAIIFHSFLDCLKFVVEICWSCWHS
ncbi:MAG TPA: glycosyltransferase [Balneolaceae bacterium]|nr:glycosyltransferase [Balneolaceae bacterium]